MLNITVESFIGSIPQIILYRIINLTNSPVAIFVILCTIAIYDTVLIVFTVILWAPMIDTYNQSSTFLPFFGYSWIEKILRGLMTFTHTLL